MTGSGENLVFSPYSVSTALEITYEGVKGTTAQQIQSVLHLPQNTLERRSAAARIYNDLNTPDAGYTLETSNYLWV